MMTFRDRRLYHHMLPMSTAWLLNDIAEAKGKQELFIRQSPQVLKALREAALIQSAESKEDYYECLNRSSQRWHEGRHEITPWMNFFLAIVRRGYAEFEHRAGQVKAPRGAKTDLVQAAIEAQAGPFRVSDIRHACPGVSLDMIRQVLKNLRGTKVECLGRGQNAQWRLIGK